MALQASCSDTLEHTRTESSPEGATAERDTAASMTSSSNLCSAHESDGSRLRRDPAEKRAAETVPEEEEEEMEMSRRVRGGVGNTREANYRQVERKGNVLRQGKQSSELAYCQRIIAFLQVKGNKYLILFGGHLHVLITVLMCM